MLVCVSSRLEQRIEAMIKINARIVSVKTILLTPTDNLIDIRVNHKTQLYLSYLPSSDRKRPPGET